MTETERNARAVVRDRRAWIAIIMIFAAMFAGAVPLTIVTLQSRATLRQITDCTTPGRACYDQGQARTGDAIQQLIDAQLAVAVCSKVETTEPGLRACVTARLKQRPR